jgi:hypothetical protein
MSDDNDKITVDGEIDAEWKSYYGDNSGEIVGPERRPDGEVSTEGEVSINSADEDQQQPIAIKPQSSTYHLVSEAGDIYCNKVKASKPGHSSKGLLFGTLNDVSGEWSLCQDCEAMDGVGTLTADQEVELLRRAAGLEPRGGYPLNKDERRHVTQQLVDDDELQTLIRAVTGVADE